MSLWEYKVISSGKGGFATPALLEKFLNDLGRDEWEIVEFRAQPDNPLAFSGLARRSTQRDWTLEDAAAAAAKAEAEKLRAEFEAKFKAATTSSGGGAAEERAPSLIAEKAAPEDDFRKLVDTSRDDDPEADDEEKDDWDKLTAAEDDELPSFFDAIKPHMRRNQRGPGQSVGVDYLAKKWDQSEDDLKGALAECGFEVPEDEDTKPVYVEYDGDLYWLNINRRGELWINTKEKPRPMFKAVKAQRVTVEEEAKPESGHRRPDHGGPKPEREAPPTPANEFTGGEQPSSSAPSTPASGAAAPLPTGPELLQKIRPLMRRNRRGPGGSGSASFLSRALKTSEADLKAAFVALGLTLPTAPNDKPVYAEFGNEVWWLNTDSRGGLWINGREKKPGETLASASEADNASADAGANVNSAASETKTDVAPSGEAPSGPAAGSNPTLAAVRLLLKETKTGAIAGKVERLAEELAKPAEEFLATLVSAGLKVPEKPREKPVFVEQAGEIFWLNKNAKGELWLNAKASKFADKKSDTEGADNAGGASDGEGDGEKKPARRGGRSRKKAE